MTSSRRLISAPHTAGGLHVSPRPAGVSGRRLDGSAGSRLLRFTAARARAAAATLAAFQPAPCDRRRKKPGRRHRRRPETGRTTSAAARDRADGVAVGADSGSDTRPQETAAPPSPAPRRISSARSPTPARRYITAATLLRAERGPRTPPQGRPAPRQAHPALARRRPS